MTTKSSAWRLLMVGSGGMRRRNGTREAEDLQLVIVSRDDHCPIVPPQTQRLNVSHLSLEHEPTLRKIHGVEALAVAGAAQHEPIAGVVASENRRHAEL